VSLIPWGIPYRRGGTRRSIPPAKGRGADAGGMSGHAGAAATVAIVASSWSRVMVAVRSRSRFLVVIHVLVAVVAPANQARMTFVFGGTTAEVDVVAVNSKNRCSNKAIQLHWVTSYYFRNVRRGRNIQMVRSRQETLFGGGRCRHDCPTNEFRNGLELAGGC